MTGHPSPSPANPGGPASRWVARGCCVHSEAAVAHLFPALPPFPTPSELPGSLLIPRPTKESPIPTCYQLVAALPVPSASSLLLLPSLSPEPYYLPPHYPARTPSHHSSSIITRSNASRHQSHHSSIRRLLNNLQSKTIIYHTVTGSSHRPLFSVAQIKTNKTFTC